MGNTDKIRRGPGWIYSSGQMDHLSAWDPYIQGLSGSGLLRDRYLFVHCIGQYAIDGIAQGFPWDLWDEALSDAGGRQMVVVLDSHKEGPSWRHVADTVARMQQSGTDPQCVIHWTGGSHESGSPINTITTMDAFCLISPIGDCLPQPLPTHHFIMLARVPRAHRVVAAVEIMQRGLEGLGYMSCGSGDYGHRVVSGTWPFNVLVPQDLQHRFPVLLPGSTETTTVFTPEDNTASVRMPVVTGAFCNVIPESSHDLMAPLPCTAFMSEKSEKAFLLGQVPIWVAAPGQAGHARDWGFDLFDDIVDHGYDAEPDPHRRVSMAMDQLERICSQPLDHWIGYKLRNGHRFENNRRRCEHLREHLDDIQYGKLVACISGMPRP